MKIFCLKKTNGIGIITINRPKVLNALNKATMTELKDLVEKVAQDREVSAVIITGSTEKILCGRCGYFRNERFIRSGRP